MGEAKSAHEFTSLTVHVYATGRAANFDNKAVGWNHDLHSGAGVTVTVGRLVSIIRTSHACDGRRVKVRVNKTHHPDPR